MSNRKPVLFLAALLLAAPAAAVAKPAAGYKLTVELKGVKARKGFIGCLAFNSDKGFPGDRKRAVASAEAVKRGSKTVCEFTLPGKGVYAVTAMHDENRNNKLDTNFVGAPTEGWASSNNVTHTFRGPSFAESRFRVVSPASMIAVDMHY